MKKHEAERAGITASRAGFLNTEVISERNPDGTRTGYYEVRIACDSCHAMVVNNVPTHERGCPRA